jgi:hypothetical protein
MSRLTVHLLAIALLATAFGTIADPARAQRPEIHQSGRETHGTDLAIGGFDTVAFHTEGKALPGTPTYRVAWRGAEWRFATAANRDLFVQNPARYAPQFGGYCAFAVAYGSTAPGDPRHFTIANGKLYLNLNQPVQTTWVRDQENLIRRGEANWPKALD